VQPGSPTFEAIMTLLREAAAIVGDTSLATADPDIEFVRAPGTVQRVPIDRSSARPAVRDGLATFNTLAGLEFSIGAFWSDEMRALMALVLWQAEAKPYVEGLIAFSRELRIKYDAFATASGAETGLGPYRRAFFELSAGKRAPWSLDVHAGVPSDIRIAKANARFVKGLQHELRGSAARAQVLYLLAGYIARARDMSEGSVMDALGAATGNDRPQGIALP
jgi:hypothetical protein